MVVLMCIGIEEEHRYAISIKIDMVRCRKQECLLFTFHLYISLFGKFLYKIHTLFRTVGTYYLQSLFGIVATYHIQVYHSLNHRSVYANALVEKAIRAQQAFLFGIESHKDNRPFRPHLLRSIFLGQFHHTHRARSIIVGTIVNICAQLAGFGT